MKNYCLLQVIKLHKEYIWTVWFAFNNVFLWFLTSFVPHIGM